MLDMACSAAATFTGAVLVNLLSVVGARRLPVLRRAAPAARRRSRRRWRPGFALVPGLARDDRRRPRRSCRSPARSRRASWSRSRSVFSVARLPARRRHRGHGRLAAARRSRSSSLGIGIGTAETVSNELILASAPAGEGRGSERGVRDRVRARRGARHGDARRHPHRVLPRAPRAARRACRRAPPTAARETLAGAMHAAPTGSPATLGRRTAGCRGSHAFDAGVGRHVADRALLIVVAGGRSRPSTLRSVPSRAARSSRRADARDGTPFRKESNVARREAGRHPR